MHSTKFFDDEWPDRRTALELANYRLLNVQTQIATLSDLSKIKLPAQKRDTDDVTVLFNGLRSRIALTNYTSGILQDTNAELIDAFNEIALRNDHLAASIAENGNLKSKIAELQDHLAQLQDRLSQNQDRLSQKIAELDLIHNSRSWRITRILRVFSGFVARLKQPKAF